jgi:phage shock protein A
MDDTDLSSLSPEAAREYVLAHITSLKTTRRQREQIEADISLWQERSRLAADRGAADLSEKAATVVSQLQAKRAPLETEERELGALVVRLKESLKERLIKGERLVDTDRLLAELEMAVGEEKATEIETDRALNESRAQTALDELKKKMRGSGQA